MALKPAVSGLNPLGQFDGLDSEVTAVLGGEVGTITGVAVTGTDQAAADADGSDGYVGIPPNHARPVITRTLASGNRPLGLIDDGTANYGTLFGEVVGGTVGQQSVNGTVLGPHTAEASGKLTFWDKPGTYRVTLDAVDRTATTGLIPTNPTLSVGDALFATTSGLLTPNSGAQFEAVTVARFLEFATNGSLVRTPVNLVSALNSPSGQSAQVTEFTEVLIHFHPPGS